MIVNKFRKGLVFAVIILFIYMSITPSTAFDNIKKSSMLISNGNTLYVGGSGEGNYSKIQDAIDNATNGDTVFVYDDSSPYSENIKIDKSIHLVGENQETTVIDGQYSAISVSLIADEITFTGFTVKNNKLFIPFMFNVYSNNNTIIGNIFTNNQVCNIFLMNSTNNITENLLLNSIFGIVLSGSDDNIITRNIITEYDYGIFLGNSRRNIISMNNIIDNKYRVPFLQEN